MNHSGKPPVVVAENMGRPRDTIAPVDIAYIYPDPPENLDVMLQIYHTHENFRGRHWAIVWQTAGDLEHGRAAFRTLQTSIEPGKPHYTNWGPLTKTFKVVDPETPFALLPLANLSLSDRQRLEDIARETPVYVPNGNWNCQDWVMMVLDRAVELGLIPAASRDNALWKARTRGAIFAEDAIIAMHSGSSCDSVASYGVLGAR
ncbi:hypothetical protein EXIGLDRAFT_727163 [Exidia glandulosa HHB12029]|uniref:Uncharacterized protein n=1 Tax=Exidia glandulosa HHB12029 TaxID=1314781 RepID=A0A165ZP06_EXIGL|nr:hypothetical protein EXIGLDRAFT_727163 [Exidia glandulosa HHB12029]